jgi:hypothetical protein
MTVPQTDRTVQFGTALRSLATRAAQRYPGEQARIDRGLVLALNNHVTLHPDGTATVQSGSNQEVVYYVGHGQCDCPDAGRPTTLYCKHVWSACLVKKAMRSLNTPQKRIAYHAEYQGQYGQAIRDEAGLVWFHADNDRMTRLYDTDMPALMLFGRVDITATAKVDDARTTWFQGRAIQR